MLAYSRFVGDGWSIGASALGGDGRCGWTPALRVNAKLGTLSLAEGILLLRVHDTFYYKILMSFYNAYLRF